MIVNSGSAESGTSQVRREERWFKGRHGLRIAATAWGDPDCRTVVLLHGGGQTRHAWGQACERLALGGYYAVSLDLRGHGDSEWAPNGDYSLRVMARDLAACCSELGESIRFVGASAGGLTALMAISTQLVSARALVLVDIVPEANPKGVERVVAFMSARPDGFASVDEAADLVQEYMQHRARPSLASGLLKNLRATEDGRFVWHWDPRFMDGMQAGVVERKHLVRLAHSIDTPVLLIRGGASDVVTEVAAERFVASLPSAHLVTLPDAGHMVAGDRNDRFTDAVSTFLDRFP